MAYIMRQLHEICRSYMDGVVLQDHHPRCFLFFGVYIALDARKRWADYREMTLKALEEETDDYDPTSDQ